MTDLIARALLALSKWLFPANGNHRIAEPPADTQPAAKPTRRPLPTLKSRYAAEAAATFIDTLGPVRPYYYRHYRALPRTAEQRAQAERRWALDMATRGIDVGPSVIHGVPVSSGSRTVRVEVAV
ncbi:hypothetical protein [Streptomyces sp. NBC_00474]|uniref:hypothetical protein n=1 Tax=Streptomyces sp. NBC_00474 TaxID=2975754 RepID=UPI002257C23D|nr:hypothetical protein [Streptomyces sp. NBC_00474]MCX5050970.1 hypothetical protein [Streptomyces sp. NBC_00474]